MSWPADFAGTETRARAKEAYADEHDWWDDPPQENTRCRRCSIKHGYFWEAVKAGRFDLVRCKKETEGK